MAKHILITGASSGIGEHLAKRIAEDQKYHVYAGVRKPGDAERLKALNLKNLEPIILDVTKAEDIEKFKAQIKKLDALVNNAGIAVAGPLEFLPISAFENQLQVNVVGLLRITQACLPMIRASRGRVVNIGSIAGKVATPLVGAYSASKFAVEALTDAMRRELAPSGIEVSVVEPGVVKTPIWERSTNMANTLLEQMPPEAKKIYGSMIQKLMDRVATESTKGAEPEEVYTAVWHALTAEKPKTRYLVGTDAKIGNIARILPDRIFDKLMKRAGA